jgi:hypothetical protein
MKTFTSVILLSALASAAVLGRTPFDYIEASNSQTTDKRQGNPHESAPTNGLGSGFAMPDISALLGNVDLTPFISMGSSLIQTWLPKVSQYAHLAVQSQLAMKIEELPPLLRKDAKRVKITYGPYQIRGQKVFLRSRWCVRRCF